MLRIFGIIGMTVFLLSCAATRDDQLVQQVLASNAAYYAQQADEALMAGDSDKAIQLYKKAIQTSADNPQHFLNLGVAFYKAGQLDSAETYYRKAIGKRPSYILAYYNLAYVYLDRNQPMKALDAVEKSRLYAATAPRSYLIEARAFDQLGETDRVVSSYQQAAALNPNDPTVFHELGAYYYHRGFLEDAIEQFEAGLDADSAYAPILFDLGNAHARRCDLETASEFYQQALDADPQLLGAHNNLGLIAMRRNDVMEAIESFNAALEIDSSATPVLFNLSIALQSLDSPNVALRLVNHAISRDSSFAMFYVQKGNVLMQLNRIDDAKAAFLQAIELEPDFALVYNNLGNMLIQTNEAKGAQAAYQRAIDLFPEYLDSRFAGIEQQQDKKFVDLLAGCVDPTEIAADYAQMLNNLGKAHFQLGDLDAAKNDFQQAIQYAPQFVEAYNNLAAVYQRGGETAKMNQAREDFYVVQAQLALQTDSLETAMRFCREALAIDVESAAAMAVMGRVLHQQGEPEHAATAFERAIETRPNHPLAFLYRGLVAWQENEPQAAVKDLQRAVELNPNSIRARQALVQVLNSLGRSMQADEHLAHIHFTRGINYEIMRQWDAALDEFQKAAGLDPGNGRYIAAEGLMLLKKDLETEAELMFEQALDLDANTAEAWYGLGLLANRDEDTETALQNLNKAVEINPDYGQAHYALAILYAEQNEFSQARRHAELAESFGFSFRKTFWDAAAE